MKRLTSLCLASVLAFSVALSGCSKKEEKAASSDGKATELTMLVPGYDSGYLKDQLNNGIKGFEKANPDIKVKIISVGWEELNSKIVQLYQAKEAPDIMLTGTRSLQQLIDMGALEDLTPFMTREFKDKRVESVLKTAEFNGKQYGIPMAFSSRALVYRSDLVKTPPTNWEQLLATAQEVHKANPKVYGFALPTDLQSGTDELLNFFYQNEGRIVNDKGEFTINSPANVETLDYLTKFAKDKVIPDPVSTKRDDQINLFKNGNLAMFITGPWDKEELDKNKDKAPYGVVELPAGKTKSVTLVTDSYVMSSLSKNKEAAWKFIEFMGQPEYQRPVSEAFNWFPILNDEVKDERFQTDFMKPFAALIDKGVAEPHVPNWDIFNKAFTTAVQKALTGQESAKAALDQAQKEVTK